jgi:hypothetical protein
MQHSCKCASRVGTTRESCQLKYVGLLREQVPDMNGRTEDGDAVTLVIILHEEFVTFHYVLGKVPRKCFVKNPGSDAEERRDDARLKVGPDASLRNSQLG